MDRRNYRPPWGEPQSEEEFDQIHSRWAKKLKEASGRNNTKPPWRPNDKDYDNGQLLQCGGCSYFIPVEGGLGMDWGACTNPKSEHDRTCVFEHFGCLEHSVKPSEVSNDDDDLDP